MADTRITELTEDTAPLGTDLLVTVHDPDGTPVNRKVTIANVVRFNCGSYTGNGAANRAIAVGFQPKLVMVWGTSDGKVTCRIDATDGEAVVSSSLVSLSGTAIAGLVLSATGFVTANDDSVGGSCNFNGLLYKWEAWG